MHCSVDPDCFSFKYEDNSCSLGGYQGVDENGSESFFADEKGNLPISRILKLCCLNEGYAGTLKVGKKITEMATWGEGWRVSFEFFQTSPVSGYHWIMLARKNDDPDIGYGAPAVWVRTTSSGNWIYPYFRKGDDNSFYRYTTYQLNTWTSFSLTSYAKEDVRMKTQENLNFDNTYNFIYVLRLPS